MTEKKTTATKKATVKQPEDHKPKATAQTEAQGDMSLTAHLLGRDWQVDASRITDDFEFIERLTAFYAGGQATILSTAHVLVGLLGSEQYEALKDHLRDDEGRVPPSQIIEFARDLLEEASPNS